MDKDFEKLWHSLDSYQTLDIHRQDMAAMLKVGHELCKQKVLEILKQDWTGADLSINSCDEFYTKKIEEEL